MFSTIAPRYDFITRAFSYGMDRRWKRTLVRRARLPENAAVLDLASGTGDFSLEISARYPKSKTVAVDLTERMLKLARARGVQAVVCADAGLLPFPTACFDCVFIGYGLRNFPQLPVTLREIERVTRPGGLLLSLDFFLPAAVEESLGPVELSATVNGYALPARSFAKSGQYRYEEPVPKSALIGRPALPG